MSTGGVEQLLNEVRRTYHLAVRVGGRLHRGEPLTLGMRAVLEHLQEGGPASVPALARQRFVTRQHIQLLVNALVERGLAELQPNPAHRRSPLVALTPQGQRCIARIRSRESRIFASLDRRLGSAATAQATRTLRRLQEAMGGEP